MVVLLPRAHCLPLLKQVGHLISKQQLQQLHAHSITSGLALHLSLLCALTDCCCRRGEMNYACLICTQIEEPNKRWAIWNSILRCSAPQEAISLYFTLVAERGAIGYADKFTFTYVFRACSRLSALWEGKQIHTQVLKAGFASDIAVQTTSVHFYARSGDVDSARHLFDKMPKKSSATWNAMITGYSSQSQSQLHGRRSDDYAREALFLFRIMLTLQSSKEEDGEENGASPTETTMLGLLSACSHLGVSATGSCVHGYICKTIPFPEESNVFIGTGLVSMYSKCGCLSSSLQVFKRMKERNVLTWTAMMAGLAIHGQGKEALKLLDAMEVDNIAPNAVTFTCLLCACCHAGLVEEGLHLFQTMCDRFGIIPQIQHYGCIVQLLGRAGLLEQAYKFIIKMPLEPDNILWRTLLAACKIHGNVVLGEKVGKLLLEMEQGLPEDIPRTSEDYIALSSIYAFAERWEDVSTVREIMKGKGIWNKPGQSEIQVSSAVN